MFYTIFMVSGEQYSIESDNTYEHLRDIIIKSRWVEFTCSDGAKNRVLVNGENISSFVSCNV